MKRVIICFLFFNWRQLLFHVNLLLVKFKTTLSPSALLDWFPPPLFFHYYWTENNNLGVVRKIILHSNPCEKLQHIFYIRLSKYWTFFKFIFLWNSRYTFTNYEKQKDNRRFMLFKMKEIKRKFENNLENINELNESVQWVILHKNLC